MPLNTTCIGAYPKPGRTGTDHWGPDQVQTGGKAGQARSFHYGAGAGGEVNADRSDADTRAAVRDQVACGVDIPTDGEQRRENYIHYHCHHFHGFDFEQLTRKVHRSGGAVGDLPTITGKIAPKPGHFLDHDYLIAQAATERPVKITLPGPLTIIDTTADAHYGDANALTRDLADALNYEVRALAAAGCRHIQIDEPLFAREVDDALSFGMECLDRCFHGLPPEVTRVMHMCCGYPGQLDEVDYPKADPGSYFALAGALDQCAIDQISIEHAHRANEGRLLELFARKDVILGVVDIAISRIEPVEEIVDRLTRALEHIAPDRLIAAPDCGLPLLDRAGAMAKLTNMCIAAGLV
jgi:5-methyltetrahydropteroyltriglutamate--homocysteine methyltransferase